VKINKNMNVNTTWQLSAMDLRVNDTISYQNFYPFNF